MLPVLGAIALAGAVAAALSSWLAIAPTAVLVFALLVGVLKGRYATSAIALAVAVGLALLTEAAVGTISVGATPFGDAWIVVLLMVAAWAPALFAACGEAAENSLWARSGRSREATPLPELAANFIWVLAVILLGALYDGAGIVGAEIFCAVFAALLAGVLLFGLGGPRVQPATQ